MIRRLVPLLAALALWATQATAAPAFFVARAPGITLYLLGSIHGLPPDAVWETPAIDHAFDTADECWFELVIAEAKPKLLPLMIRYGFDPKQGLLDGMTDAQAEQLRTAVDKLELPGGMAYLKMMRPWLASTMLTTAWMQHQGIDFSRGVDTILQDRAIAHGLPVRGLEDAEEQIRIMADLPDTTSTQMLVSSLDLANELPARFAALLHSWAAGDIDAVGQQTAELEGGMTPEILESMFTRRNAAWAKRLATLQNSNKTVFVTVGAGHLVGEGNLRDQLTQAGFTVERTPASP